MIDHRGLLSLDPFTKGLELTALEGNGCPVICFAREDYRVITPSESRVPKITLGFEDTQTLGFSNYIPGLGDDMPFYVV